MNESFDIENYKVQSIVDEHYEDSPVNLINFKDCLQADIALEKRTKMLDNGRPENCEYYWQDVLYAKIRFEFTDHNLLLRNRKEYLHYMKNDDTWGPAILIKDKTYNHLDLKDLEAAVRERIDARSYIVNSMKGFLAGIIMQIEQKPLTEVIKKITPYWFSIKKEREDFIEFGTDDWKQRLIEVDLDNTTYSYLGYEFDAPHPDGSGTIIKVKVRDYMLSRLTY